jgi:three-Cys-motif partner protein
MPKKHYEWSLESPTEIEQHSVAKHDILREYLINYVQTLVSPYQEEFKLTLVDGFSGGGIYRHKDTRELIYGSPIIMLEAIKHASFLINRKRHKPIELKVDYFFVDHNKSACDCLTYILKEQGYGNLVGKSIFILKDSFAGQAEKIMDFIVKKSPRAQRAIFLLDQYGYDQVPASQINRILKSLSCAEIILNFNVAAFLTYASDKKNLAQKKLTDVGIPDALHGRSIEDIKSSERDWRLYIQSCLHQGLVQNCGARYYTPFFIRSSSGHGDYWLVHLSQHPRARDVMTQIHWQKNNCFIHYGGSGLDMFGMIGYVPKMDSSYKNQMEFDFCFDDVAKKASIESLLYEIPYLVRQRGSDGISFLELFSKTCNNSPASGEIYKIVLNRLIDYKEIEIISKEGARRYSANTIHDTDQIITYQQCSIFSLPQYISLEK